MKLPENIQEAFRVCSPALKSQDCDVGPVAINKVEVGSITDRSINVVAKFTLRLAATQLLPLSTLPAS